MILDAIVASRKARARDTITSRVRGPRRSLWRALDGAGEMPRVIAEHKRKSPSAGVIGPDANRAIVDVVCGYERAGAAALSILTNAEYFGASPDDLWQARLATTLPVLRKEFLVDVGDVEESAALGADAVLLIARILPGALLGELQRAAESLDLETLVEVHNVAEAEAALAVGARIIGINHRDLDTLTIDLGLSTTIRRALDSRGDGIRFVGESGLRTTGDLRRMRQAKMDAVLIGESLLKERDPGATLATLLEGAP